MTAATARALARPVPATGPGALPLARLLTLDQAQSRQVTGADDDKTFAVLASPDADRGPDRLYELQLGSGGSPAPLIRLRLALPAESSDPALSADGTAVAVTGSTGERQFIAVVSTSSGRARTGHGGDRRRGIWPGSAIWRSIS